MKSSAADRRFFAGLTTELDPDFVQVGLLGFVSLLGRNEVEAKQFFPIKADCGLLIHKVSNKQGEFPGQWERGLT
jgi:hypothetical protein